MRVMTFNIQHALDYRRRVIDIDLFARAIRDQQADICGLNEVRGKGDLDGYTDQTNALGDALGYERYFGEAIRVGGTSPYGNAMVCRYPIISAQTYLIPDPEKKRAGGSYETRCVIRAAVATDIGDITLMICHMGLEPEERANAVTTLCNLIDGTEGPLILMGDFNITPENDVLAPLRERLKDTAELSDIPEAATFPSDAPNIKIDYMFYRGLSCRSVMTPSEVVSDHLPIVADFDKA